MLRSRFTPPLTLLLITVLARVWGEGKTETAKP